MLLLLGFENALCDSPIVYTDVHGIPCQYAGEPVLLDPVFRQVAVGEYTTGVIRRPISTAIEYPYFQLIFLGHFFPFSANITNLRGHHRDAESAETRIKSLRSLRLYCEYRGCRGLL